jgi:hypothetical protein
LIQNKYNQDRFDNKNSEIENVNSAVINKRDVVTFNQFHDNQIEKDFKQIQYPLDEDECVDFSTQELGKNEKDNFENVKNTFGSIDGLSNIKCDVVEVNKRKFG